MDVTTNGISNIGEHEMVSLCCTDYSANTVEKAAAPNIPLVSIYDYPRFAYRGMHWMYQDIFSLLSLLKNILTTLAPHVELFPLASYRRPGLAH